MKKKKVFLFIIFLFVVIAITSISVGVYFNKLARPNAIFGGVIDSLSEKMNRYTKVDSAFVVGDNFTVNGDLKYEVDSEYYFNRYFTDMDIQKKYNVLINLNKLDTHYTVSQDKKKNTALLELKEMIGEEAIVFYKLFVTNSTQYYYLDGVSDTYVNNGTCNYFETLGEEITTKDNIDYLNRFLVLSLKKNMKEEYFQSKLVDENIRGSVQNVNRISIRFTDSMIHTLLKDILKDFKEDDKASKILNNIDPSFSSYKINDDKIYLEKDESYTLDIYTTKVLYKPIKFHILHLNGEEKTDIIYEGDLSGGTIYVSRNDKAEYQMPVKISSHQIFVDIQDVKGNHLGEVRLEKNQHNITFNYSFEQDNKKYDVIYSSKYSSIKKKKSYQNEKKLSFKILENKESKINGTVTLTFKVKNQSKIEEDISNAILASSLTEEQKQVFENKRTLVRERMERTS